MRTVKDVDERLKTGKSQDQEQLGVGLFSLSAIFQLYYDNQTDQGEGKPGQL